MRWIGSNGPRKKTRVLAMAAAVAGGFALAAIVVAQSSESGGGEKPVAPVEQAAVAASSGVSIQVLAARFSASGTVVSLHVDASSASIELGPLEAVVVKPEAFASELQAQSEGRILVDPEGLGSADVRFTALAASGASTEVVLRSLELRLRGGSTVRRDGDWRFTLKLPPNLSAALRAERLAPAGIVEAAGYRVRPLAAVRSASETIVTVEIAGSDGRPARQLGEPLLMVGGRELEGALVSGAQGSGVATFAFPPTPFGSPIRIKFGPLLATQDSEISSAVVRLGEAIKRQSVTGDFGSGGSLGPQDLASVATGVTVTRFDFVKSDPAVRRSDVLALTVRGNYMSPSDLVLISKDGKSRTAEGFSTNYSRQPTGVIDQGQTTIFFQIGSFDEVNGDIQVILGSPDTMAHGVWEVEFTLPK